MSYFVSDIPPFMPLIDGSGSWMVTDNIIYKSNYFDDPIVVLRGSINNLASIPFGLKNLFDINDPHRVASAVHDDGYFNQGFYFLLPSGKIHLKNLPKNKVDLVFREMMTMTFLDYSKAVSNDYITWLLMTEYGRNIYTKMNSTKAIVGTFKRESMYKAVSWFGKSAWEEEQNKL